MPISFRPFPHLLAFALCTAFGSFALAQQAQTPAKKNAARAVITAENIAEARTQLTALGYWLDTNATGLDVSFRHALIAFQKVEGRPRTGKLTTAELTALRGAKSPTPREGATPHIEVDLQRQILLMVNCGDVPLRILPVSTGSGEFFTEGGRTRQAITPTGKFKIQWKIKDWRKSALGLLYYPNYFYDGAAIHGNPAVPVYPASHGCVRIPMFAAVQFSELATVGLPLLIYDDGQ